ncbi:MAG: HEAT repeat domain-containing protein [Anaerolineae bacterium]|nr:HEAT repeat domain-containing protein [Anaerolineae bacterium]MDQ7034425.1 HEAT repeat domain-containing protein [Anaerolineae bacterium]
MKKLVEYHISRLKDKNPAIRLVAIQELELLADMESLEVLQDVFNNDPDEEVRRVAQQAGRTIFLKHRANTESESS